MFIKDEQWYLDLERANLLRNFSNIEEEEVYARLLEKGEIWKKSSKF